MPWWRLSTGYVSVSPRRLFDCERRCKSKTPKFPQELGRDALPMQIVSVILDT